MRGSITCTVIIHTDHPKHVTGSNMSKIRKISEYLFKIFSLRRNVMSKHSICLNLFSDIPDNVSQNRNFVFN